MYSTSRQPELASVSDPDLVVRLQKGEQDAFAELMARYERLVFAVALRIVRDQGEAEDMVQHVFLEIYRSRSTFDPSRGSLRTWLLRRAYTRSIERLRYLSTRKFYHATEITEIVDRVAGSESPRSALEARELVSLALQELNQPQREVIHLSHFEGYSFEEIAILNGESYGSVRHHFYRGLKKMRGRLDGEP